MDKKDFLKKMLEGRKVELDPHAKIHGAVPVMYINGKQVMGNNCKFIADDGETITATAGEIYRAYYADMSDEEYEVFYYGLDARTLKAITNYQKKLGLVDYEIDAEPEHWVKITRNVSQIDAYAMSSSDVFCGQTEDDNDNWYVQYVTFHPEDIIYHQLQFDHKPNLKEIYAAEEFRRLKSDALYRGSKHIPEFFTCRECGRKVFWLDTADDLLECREFAKDRCCGSGECANLTFVSSPLTSNEEDIEPYGLFLYED